MFAGFQGQRQWTDWQPNADFPESMLTGTFDWNGKKNPTILATEGDNCNGLGMIMENLLTHEAPIFADVRTYWSPKAYQERTGFEAEGLAKLGFMHLLNSGAAALDGNGWSMNEKGEHCWKPWMDVTEKTESVEMHPHQCTTGFGSMEHFLINQRPFLHLMP